MKHTFDRILFATDFSEEAYHAMEFALHMAQREGAALTIFHAIPEFFDFASRSQKVIDEEMETNSQRMEQDIKNIHARDGFENLKIDYALTVGKTPSNLKNEISKRKADLVVMGYQDRQEGNKFVQMLFGNITSEVVLSSDVPVLAVPPNARSDKFEDIVYASDFNKKDIQVLDFLGSFTRKVETAVEILHVDKEINEKTEKDFEDFRGRVLKALPAYQFVFRHLEGDDVGKTISQFLKTEQVDLLVVGRKERNFLQYIFTMGEAPELGFCKDIPLLVIPMDALES